MKLNDGMKKGIGIGVLIAAASGAIPLVEYAEKKWSASVNAAAEAVTALQKHRADHEYTRHKLCDLDEGTFWYKGGCLDKAEFNFPERPD